MARTTGRQYSFIFFIALCIIVVGANGLSWKVDPKSGGSGTTLAGRMGLASYDLDAGDTIHYDYSTNVPCWFVVTIDPLNPGSGERLNLSGSQNSGQLDCPSEGLYVIQVTFLELPDGGEATVDYAFYALDDSSRTMLIVKPVLMTSLTAVLTAAVSIANRRPRRGRSSLDPGSTPSYWDFFASKPGNWIAIVAGAALLSAGSIIDSAGLSSMLSESFWYWMISIGSSVLILGLILGLAMTWSEYKSSVPKTGSKSN